MARIDDLLYVDDLTKHSDNTPSFSKVGLIGQKNIAIPYSVAISDTPYRASIKTPSFSPAQLFNPANKGERSPFIPTGKLPQRGLDVRKVITDFIGIDTRGVKGGELGEQDSISNASIEASASPPGPESF